MSTLPKMLHKIKREGPLSDSFHKVCYQTKLQQKKMKTTDHVPEKHRYKNPQQTIYKFYELYQDHIEKNIHHDRVCLIPRMQVC